MNVIEEFKEKLKSSEPIFKEILEVCGNKFQKGCGSYLFDGQTYEYHKGMFEKQLLLYTEAKNTNTVLEIGTYMSHSLLIMLLANPKIEITSIDIDDTYTWPTIQLLKSKLGAQITFIKGNSLEVLPSLKGKWDLFHIDGSHTLDFVRQEFDYCKNLSNQNPMRLIIDDYLWVKEITGHISQNHLITKQLTPNCDWTNSYLEINL